METTYNIVRECGEINKRTDQLGNKWVKKLAIISWNGKPPLFDIREWSADGDTCRSGMRLSRHELYKLGDIINEIREESDHDNGTDDREKAQAETE